MSRLCRQLSWLASGIAVLGVAGLSACRTQSTSSPPSKASTQPPAAHVTQRPPVMGRNAGVSTGHPLATAAALELLMRGGNAFDAGVAAMLLFGVVEQDLYSLGGEGTALVYPRATGK